MTLFLMTLKFKPFGTQFIYQWARHICVNGYVALKSGRSVGNRILRSADEGNKMYHIYADDSVLAKASAANS